MDKRLFEWDANKESLNIKKHGLSFGFATRAFDDPFHVITEDAEHSAAEERYYCFGMVAGKVVTVRFTLRSSKIRIFGAVYWREGKKEYEKQNGFGRI